MATHSSILAWRIPGTGEPGGLPSMGSHRVGHDWSDLAAAAAADFRHILSAIFQKRGFQKRNIIFCFFFFKEGYSGCCFVTWLVGHSISVTEWMSEWLNEWVSEWMNEWVSEWMSEWVNEWVSEWMNGWLSEWMNEWVNECWLWMKLRLTAFPPPGRSHLPAYKPLQRGVHVLLISPSCTSNIAQILACVSFLRMFTGNLTL